MLKTRLEWTILMLLTALGGTAWIAYSREPAVGPGFVTLTEAPIVGLLAPDFTLQTASGESHRLGDHVGRQLPASKPVVLNFWATWCAPCRIEMPHLQAASQEFEGRVTFIGVNQAESGGTITDFARELDLTFPLLVDPDNTVNRLYGINSLPTTVFIDADGIVREIVIGSLNEAVLQDRVNRLLEKGK